MQLWGNAHIMIHMGEGRRVFTDATHSSIRGCKNSIARLTIESRAAWALENEEETKPAERSIYKRRYRWNERNLMQESSDNTQSVHYRYGQDGQRALKSSNQSETLYFNTMWSWLHNSSAYNTDRESKHIYLGTERLVTRMNGAGSQGNAYTAQVSTYYYHSDHLGSAQLITDNEGREYERIEYTPYGEYWVEKRAPENRTLPFKFTGKERDEETGLYYYGARYMDPRTSRWLSTDPALTDYIPTAPVDDNARKHNQNLPGMGGIYNSINMHLYHYAGNNPVKYTDPTGMWTLSITANTTAAAGTQGTVGIGIVLGFSLKKGLTLGLVKTYSIGAQEGASANGSISISFNPKTEEVVSGTNKTLTVGGSGTIPIGVGLGGDIAIDLETSDRSYSASLSLGAGTPGEAHQLYTETKTITTDDIAQKIYDNMTPQGIIKEAARQQAQKRQESENE